MVYANRINKLIIIKENNKKDHSDFIFFTEFPTK